MTVTPGNLSMGPGDLYVAPFGSAEPFPSELNGTPAASAFADCGGTMGGLSFTVVNTWKELEVDQIIEVPERRRTKREVTVKTQLAEVTFANFTIAMDGGTTTTPATLVDQYDPDDVNSGDSPSYKAVLFDGFGVSGLRRRVIVRKCLNTENVDVAAHPTNQTVFPVTFTSHYVSSSIRPWRIFQARTS